MRKTILFISLIPFIINAYPYFNPIRDTCAREGELFELQISAWSLYGHPLVFDVQCPFEEQALENVGKISGCACSKTEWAAFFYFFADYDLAGLYTIVFSATDTIDHKTCYDTVMIEIYDHPLPPTLSINGADHFIEHDTLRLLLDYSDEDTPDSLFSWKFQSSFLSVEKIHDTLAVFVEGFGYGNDTLNVSLSDSGGLTVTDTLHITCHNVNDPPRINPFPDRQGDVNDTISIDLSDQASDPDHDFSQLEWNIETRILHYEINRNEIKFYYPGEKDVATDSITWIVSDPEGLADTAYSIIKLEALSSVHETREFSTLFSCPYPNPFRDFFTIDFGKPFTGYFRLYRLDGALVEECFLKRRSSFTWKSSRTKLSSGTYFISLSNPRQKRKFKISCVK